MAQRKVLRKKKPSKKGPRKRKPVSPEERIDGDLSKLGFDLDQLLDEIQEVERAAGEVGGSIEELRSELAGLRHQVAGRFQQLKQPAVVPRSRSYGSLACCQKMVEAQKPGSLPHVMQNDAGEYLLHSCPFNACPWCGQRVDKP